HEMRNPLAPIGNGVAMLRMMRADLPAPLVQMGEIMERQLGHLTRLVDDLLDVGRIVTGKILLRHEPLDYRDVVLGTVDAVRPTAEKTYRHTLVVDVPADPIRMTGDATRLAQSLQNLLNNAMRYTPPGGEIRVRVALEDAACVTSVSDNGRGISPDALDRIFELFVQEESSSLASGPRDGLGIGLSLARTLIEQHGGMLTAESPGRDLGSTFTIRLPLRPTATADARDGGELPVR